MGQGTRDRDDDRDHWTRIGRDLASELEGMDKFARARRIRELAEARGLSAHTLQRYVVLSGFLKQLNLNSGTMSQLGVAQMEVIFRIWNVNPQAALSALRQAEKGLLSFRRALELEKKVRSRAEDSARNLIPREQSHLAETASVAPLQAWTELDPLDEPRFAITPVHRIFALGKERIAVIDEELVSSGAASSSEFPSLARGILQAAALFDEVRVLVAKRSSIEKLQQLLLLCLPPVSSRIFIDTGRFHEKAEERS